MTGLQKIIDQINNSAKESVTKIEEESSIAIAKALAEITADGEKQVQTIAEKADAQCIDILERGKSSAALQQKKAILSAKQEIITTVISEALNTLCNAPTQEYFDTIYKMIKKNSLHEFGEIAFNKKDLSRLPKDFNSKLSDYSNGKLKLAKEPKNINGGFVLIYGGIEENCSFDAMFASANEKLQDNVHNMLFL